MNGRLAECTFCENEGMYRIQKVEEPKEIVGYLCETCYDNMTGN